MRALAIAAACLTLAAGVRAAGLAPADAVELAPAKDALQRFPHAAFGSGKFLVVWQDGWNGDGGKSDIRGAFLAGGAPAKSFAVTGDAFVQERPALAASKDAFLVAWQDWRGGKDADIYAARVSAEGKVLDAEGIAIATGAGTQCNPTVASDGEGFIVAWQGIAGEGAYGVRAVRVGADGAVKDAKPLALGTGGTPAAAFGEGKYLVVWTTDPAARTTTVQGSLIPPGGAAGAAFPVMKICTLAPSVAAGTKGFVVVATSRPYPSPWGWGGPAGVVGARVTFAGGAPDAGVSYDYYHKGLSARSRPNILDSSRWKRKGGAWPAGQVGGFGGTENDQWPHYFSAIAPHGDGFVSVWVRRKIRNRWMLHDADLYGSRVSTDPWRVPEQGGVEISAGERNEGFPCLASGGGKILLVYEAVTDNGVQAMARFLKAE